MAALLSMPSTSTGAVASSGENCGASSRQTVFTEGIFRGRPRQAMAHQFQGHVVGGQGDAACALRRSGGHGHYQRIDAIVQEGAEGGHVERGKAPARFRSAPLNWARPLASIEAKAGEIIAAPQSLCEKCSR